MLMSVLINKKICIMRRPYITCKKIITILLFKKCLINDDSIDVLYVINSDFRKKNYIL